MMMMMMMMKTMMRMRIGGGGDDNDDGGNDDDDDVVTTAVAYDDETKTVKLFSLPVNLSTSLNSGNFIILYSITAARPGELLQSCYSDIHTPLNPHTQCMLQCVNLASI